MRTALVISGQVKRLQEDAPSVISNLIEPLNADVFMSIWKPTTNTVDDVLTVYNPKSYEVEEPIEFSNLPHKASTYNKGISTGTKMANVFGMYYKVWRGNEVRRIYEIANGFTYDRVIRFRFEIGISQRIHDLVPVPNTIYIPNGQDHMGGICDTTAIGDSESMNVYASVFSKLRHYWTLNYPLHPESVLRKHLELTNMKIERFSLKTTLRGRAWNA